MEMKTFARPHRAEAEKAAADWWDRQTGLKHLSECAAPISADQGRFGPNRWRVTVVYVSTDLPDTELEGLEWMLSEARGD
jgi:hypothetical protein